MVTSPRRALPVLPVAAAVVLALVAGRGGPGGEDEGLAQVRPVEVSGEPLPPLADGAVDPAIGRPVPEARGATFDGTVVVIVRDGQPKLIAFLAHWCPHCQREVPVVDRDGKVAARASGEQTVAQLRAAREGSVQVA